MYHRSYDDFFGDDISQPTYTPRQSILNADLTINDGPPGSVTPGHLDGTFEGAQEFVVHLTAGVTYSFAQRPTDTGGIEDAFLYLFNSSGGLITYDDDGGSGRSSLLSFTPTTTGDYKLLASSWVNEFDVGGDVGDYNLFQWDSTQPDAGGTLATAMSITTGTTFGSRTGGGDIDMYKIDLVAGQFYTFGYSGGFDGAGETGTVGQIQLLDSAGNVIVSPTVTAETGMSYFVQTSGTYYVQVTPWAGTAKGGYTLDVSAVDPSTRDPLESLNWDSADNIDTVLVGGVETAYVYFAPAGVNYGEKEANGTPMVTFGWTAEQQAAVMSALGQYTPITGIQYLVTTDESQAEFRMLTTSNTVYGARFYPQDEDAYGTQQGIGTFNLISGGFGDADTSSLLPGGFSYGVILHEFGHAHGIAHPHDNGGGSEIMLGVTGATGSLGVYDLNQGVYTVMSYNDGWNTHPDGDRNFSRANWGSGWSQTLGAFDIAVLQARYGVHDANTGNTTYTIADTQATASYQTIWDTGGNDTINYVGTKDVQIDLLAATLDYTPTGGGVVSFAHNVWGGFTIANGVVIENATGGEGNDVLLGNSAANTLTGNGGNDNLLGRAGNDRIIGGAGVDTVTGGDGLDVATLGAGNDKFIAEATATKVSTKMGSMSVDIITDFDTNGNDVIDLSGFDHAFNFKGTSNNKNAWDLSYKTYDSINGAENALGFDIDGNPGASGIAGKVTVVLGNVDGGKPDFMIVLLGQASVDASDFIF